jgi:hypothetical protein
VEAGGIVYWVTGGAGAALYAASGDWFTEHASTVYHFLLVEAHDCWLLVKAIDRDGEVFDSYRLDRCADLAPK